MALLLAMGEKGKSPEKILVEVHAWGGGFWWPKNRTAREEEGRKS